MAAKVMQHELVGDAPYLTGDVRRVLADGKKSSGIERTSHKCQDLTYVQVGLSGT